MRPIKFRVWATKTKKWLNIYDFANDKNGIRPFGISPEIVVIQQFTGLKDKTGKDVYEGDIIKFKYDVGDFAWEFMELEEKESQHKMLGKPFTCAVTWTKYNAGFELINRNKKSTHISFPVSYCRSGKVIGNIFENKL